MTEPTEADPIAEDHAGLQASVRSGFRFSIANTVVARAWTFVLGLLLARLLEVEDFGVYAIALASLMVLQSANELGTTVAVIRWRGDPLRAARTATTIALVSSSLLYIGVVLLAPTIADQLGSKEATGVIRLLLFGVVLDGVSGVPSALLTRGFQQRRKLVADMSGLLTTGVVTLTLAVLVAGPWALAWGSLVGNAVTTFAILALAPSVPRPGFDRHDAVELLRIGLPLAGASLLLGVMLNIDYVIIGGVLGPTALGLYLLAFNLSSWPPNLLTGAVRQISLPAFAQLSGDPPLLAATFLRWFRILVTVAVGVAALLASLAGPTIRFVYGDRWSAAAQALTFLAALGAIRIVVDLCYDLLVAVGRTSTIMAIQCLWVATLIPAIWLGADIDGIRGASIGHVVVGVVVVLPLFLLGIARSGVSPRALAVTVARPLGAGLAAWILARFVDQRVESDVVALIGGGAAGAALYLVLAVPGSGWKSVRSQLTNPTH